MTEHLHDINPHITSNGGSQCNCRACWSSARKRCVCPDCKCQGAEETP